MYLKFVALEKKESDEVKTALVTFGIDSLLSCKVKTLSGGEKQRLKMAMMFLSNPDIILLDEPTAKLDDENINSILKVIEHVWKDKLILIVTHHRLPFSQPIKELHLKGGKLQ